MSQYFPKPYEPYVGDINVKVNLSNYATKTDLKNISHVDVSSFALNSNLAKLKTEVDHFPSDLAKLSNRVKNDAVKKTPYDKLVTKVNNIDTTGFVLKTTYGTDKSDLEKKISDTDKKIPDTIALAKTKKKTNVNANITEIEGKIPSITGLATNLVLTAVKNKIPDVSSLVKKETTDFDAKFKKISGGVTSNKSKHLFAKNELKKLKTFDSSYVI